MKVFKEMEFNGNMHPLIEEIEKKYKKSTIPQFKAGDTVKVHTHIFEGGKERVQIYHGVVIGRRGRGLSETFKVSRIAVNYVSEKTFFLHSLKRIEVVGRGKVRRAKLGYLRGKLGKSSRVASA